MSDLGITFPPQGQWLPSLTQLTDTGTVLLAVAGGALDHYGRGERYSRRLIQHGTQPVVVKGAGNLIVRCVGLVTGKAGQAQFQFAEGALGKLAFRVGKYEVGVYAPWPTAQGGTRARLADDDVVDDAEVELDTDALLISAAMTALALGGVKAPGFPANRQVLGSSATPTNPRGGMAGWQVTVEVQL